MRVGSGYLRPSRHYESFRDSQINEAAMTPRQTDGRVVPLKVARQLLEERDRAIDELRRARARIEQLDDQRKDERQRAEDAERQVAELQDKCDEIEGRLQVKDDQSDAEGQQLERRARRLAADLKRVRDRTVESVEAARREERVRLLGDLGEVFDAIERALQMGEPTGPWKDGLEAIRDRFVDFLQQQDAGVVGEVGERMDPNIHRAISTVDSDDYESGRIVRVDRRGIVLDDGTVVRPAQVVVAK